MLAPTALKHPDTGRVSSDGRATIGCRWRKDQRGLRVTCRGIAERGAPGTTAAMLNVAVTLVTAVSVSMQGLAIAHPRRSNRQRRSPCLRSRSGSPRCRG